MVGFEHYEYLEPVIYFAMHAKNCEEQGARCLAIDGIIWRRMNGLSARKSKRQRNTTFVLDMTLMACTFFAKKGNNLTHGTRQDAPAVARGDSDDGFSHGCK